jgi:hypothetical protein
MEKVVTLFPDQLMRKQESPAEMFTRILPDTLKYNKALVLLIDERAGKWLLDFEHTGMTNAEMLMALELLRDSIVKAVVR